MAATKKRDRRFKPKTRKRVRFGPCLVLPSTLRLINQLAKSAGSQSKAVDKAVAALAVAESFGKESLSIK